MNAQAHKRLQNAVRSGDIVLVRDALRTLREAGISDRQAYRIALGGDPALTPDSWTDLVARADST